MSSLCRATVYYVQMEGSITSNYPSLLALNTMRSGTYDTLLANAPPELAEKPKYLATNLYRNGTVVSWVSSCLKLVLAGGELTQGGPGDRRGGWMAHAHLPAGLTILSQAAFAMCVIFVICRMWLHTAQAGIQYGLTDFRQLTGPEEDVRMAVGDEMVLNWEFEGFGDTYCYNDGKLFNNMGTFQCRSPVQIRIPDRGNHTFRVAMQVREAEVRLSRMAHTCAAGGLHMAVCLLTAVHVSVCVHTPSPVPTNSPCRLQDVCNQTFIVDAVYGHWGYRVLRAPPPRTRPAEEPYTGNNPYATNSNGEKFEVGAPASATLRAPKAAAAQSSGAAAVRQQLGEDHMFWRCAWSVAVMLLALVL